MQETLVVRYRERERERDGSLPMDESIIHTTYYCSGSYLFLYFFRNNLTPVAMLESFPFFIGFPNGVLNHRGWVSVSESYGEIFCFWIHFFSCNYVKWRKSHKNEMVWVRELTERKGIMKSMFNTFIQTCDTRSELYRFCLFITSITVQGRKPGNGLSLQRHAIGSASCISSSRLF